MDQAIEQMLKAYKAENLYERKNAIKEIMQEVILCGLSRAGFFNKAAFYGGTALRIFYGLDRFSEDLDFSLTSPDPDFDLEVYFPTLIKEVRAFGLNVQITKKEKTIESDIHSAFVKGNTLEYLLLFYHDEASVKGLNPGESIKIKFEVDTDPPAFATFEHKYRLLPAPYSVKLYDMPSLFAGKIHAVLARAWRNRIKGRDLYDYVFYLSHGTPVNLNHLLARLKDSGTISETDKLTINDIKGMLRDRFESIDYNQARQDVEPFIRDTSSLALWNVEFFIQITNENLKEQIMKD